MRAWTRRRWLAAALATGVSALVLGLPTDLIPNPVFGRMIEAPTWSYLALAVTSVLSGLLLATYVRDEPRRATADVAPGDVEEGPSEPVPGPERVRASTEALSPPDAKRLTAGGLMSFLAVGCPTCNKLVVLALGSSGALTYFEPVQPVLALLGIGVLGYALRRRLASEAVCEVPALRG